MITAGGKWDGLKQAYDKILLLTVLLLLLGSSGWLLIRLGVNRAGSGKIIQRSEASVKPLDTNSFADRVALLFAPISTPGITQHLITSELRVSCVNPACQLPILFHAEVCPFCQAKQPDIPTIDSDGDGIPDVMERQYGLDPYNAQDAYEDWDGDGFLNIEEFCGRTLTWLSDPTDPESFPPPIIKLRFIPVPTEPFTLRFQGVQKIGTGELIFQLNLRSKQSYFARMGQSIRIPNPGRNNTIEVFTITDFTPLLQDTPQGKRDVSMLTIEMDGRAFQLIKDQPLHEYDRLAELVFLLDHKTYPVRINDKFELMGHQYKVVDMLEEGVLVRDVELGVDTLVPRLTEVEQHQLLEVMRDPADR